ncbi:hypothetical protein U9W91_001962 [Enterobacter hormaechei]
MKHIELITIYKYYDPSEMGLYAAGNPVLHEGKKYFIQSMRMLGDKNTVAMIKLELISVFDKDLRIPYELTNEEQELYKHFAVDNNK